MKNNFFNISAFSYLIVAAAITVLFTLNSCDVNTPLIEHFTPSGTYSIAWNNLPKISEASDFKLGGFSGLYYKDGRTFYTITDRGPVLQRINEKTGAAVYYLQPDFIPRLVQLELQDDHSIKVISQIPISNPAGQSVSGRIPPASWNKDETVVNQNVNEDVRGVYPGGIVMDVQNHFFWFADQYNPALMQMTVDGQWVKRLKPMEGLRKALSNLTVSGGFSGADIDADGRLVTVTRRCLENNYGLDDSSSSMNYSLRRIIFYNPDKHSDLSLFYFVDPETKDGLNPRFACLGDVAAVNDTSLLITEFGSYGGSDRSLLYKVVIEDSTTRAEAGLEGILGKTFETLTSTEWKDNGLKAVKKELLFDLSTVGIKHPEGIAIINNEQVAVIDNNNWGITNPDPSSGSYSLDTSPVKLEIITLPVKLNLNK